MRTSWDADLEVQVPLLQVIQGDLLQPGPLQLGQALDRHRLQSHALTQHGRPRVVALPPRGDTDRLGRVCEFALQETGEPNNVIRTGRSRRHASDEALRQPRVDKKQTGSPHVQRSVSPQRQPSHRKVLSIYSRERWLFESRAADPPPQTHRWS